MKNRKIGFWLSLFVFLIAVFLLVTGSPLLTFALLENPVFPLGNLITWAGLASLPLAIYLGSKSLESPQSKVFRLLSRLLKASLVLALLWVPICALLAGNLSFSFSGSAPSFQGGQTAMRIFWIYTYSVAAAPILILIFSWLLRFFSNKKT